MLVESNRLDGNMLTLSGSGLTSQYVTWNSLCQATTLKTGSGTVMANISYDAFGRRALSQPPGANPTFFIYDGDMLLGEVRGTDNGVNIAYTWGAAGLISQRIIGTNTSL